MKTNLFISFIILTFSLVLSSCGYKDFEDNLKADMDNQENKISNPNIEPEIDIQGNNINNSNADDETVPHNPVPPIEDSSIYEVGEKVTYTFGENIQEYTITKVTENDDISSLDQNNFLDKSLLENGTLKEGYKFIMLDVTVKNISQYSSDSEILNIDMLSLVNRGDIEEDRFNPLTPLEIPYFKNPAKVPDDEKGAYKYHLPIGQSTDLQVGWIMSEEYFNSDLFICIGESSNFELRKYVEFR